MKKVTLAVSVLTASLMAMSANAAISYGTTSDAQQAYVGVKATQIDPKVYDINAKTINYGVYGGYNYDQNLGAELEFQGGSSKAYTLNAIPYEYNAKAYGVYGTYRYGFGAMPVYAKGKLGLGATEINTKSKVGTRHAKSAKTGVAGGVAVGFNPTSNVGVELGYNHLSSDVRGLSLGAHVAF